MGQHMLQLCLTLFALADILDEVVKSPSMAFLRTGKRKARFSLSLQISHLRSKRLICAPVHGRDDDF